MNIASAQLLNSSIANAGNAFGQARQFDIETAMRQQQLEEAKREALANEAFRRDQLAQQAQQHTAQLSAQTAPHATWKSNGKTITSPMNEQLAALLQQHPADPDDEGASTMTLEGANEAGVEAKLQLMSRKGANASPQAQKAAADSMAAFTRNFPHPPMRGHQSKGGAVDTQVRHWHEAQQQADAEEDPTLKAQLTAYADALFNNLPAEVKKTPQGITGTETLRTTIKPEGIGGALGTNTTTIIKRPLPTSPAIHSKADAETPDALPMPAKKSELITGRRYNTAKGVATWNGTNFEK